MLFIYLISFLTAFPQKTESTELSESALSQLKNQAENLVAYFEYTLNLIGDPATSTRDKQTLINESYLKFFKDAEVQIEDDLEPERRVPTHKNVQAYLQDVDFFFKQASFAFEIEEITHEENQEGNVYFQVAFTRELNTKGLDGKKRTHRQPRFIELNYDPEMEDLRIVSLYTTKLSEEEALARWWNEMDTEWKWFWAEKLAWEDKSMAEILQHHPEAHIGDTLLEYASTEDIFDQETSIEDLSDLSTAKNARVEVQDSLPSDTIFLSHPDIFDGLRKLKDLKKLDLTKLGAVKDLSPLSQMIFLKELVISNLELDDLTPLRHLTGLEVFQAEGIPIKDLSPLRYAKDLQELFLDHSKVDNLEILQHFPQLKVLTLRETPITEIGPVAQLDQLTYLDISHTAIQSIDSLKALDQLKYFYAESSKINNIQALSGKSNLLELNLSHTQVSELAPILSSTKLSQLKIEGSPVQDIQFLGKLPALNLIYADSSAIPDSAANDFMLQHPGKLLLYQSDRLLNWWESLGDLWKSNLLGTDIKVDPGALHRLTLVKELDLQGLGIKDVNALAPLINLTKLNIADNEVEDISALAGLAKLTEIDLHGTQVSDLGSLGKLSVLQQLDAGNSSVKQLNGLETAHALELLRIDSCMISDLSPLHALPSIKKVYADQTNLEIKEVRKFYDQKPNIELIFQTDTLASWWSGLDAKWKKIFIEQEGIGQDDSKENLHKIACLFQLKIADGTKIRSLEPLQQCFQLKELTFTNTLVQRLGPLRAVGTLEKLDCSQNPIEDLFPLVSLKNLTSLNVNNTALSKLDLIKQLPQLKALYISGTSVKDLRPLAGLSQLEELDCSSTLIKSLKTAESLPALKSLICYNTKLTERKVSAFKTSFPNVEVIFY